MAIALRATEATTSGGEVERVYLDAVRSKIEAKSHRAPSAELGRGSQTSEARALTESSGEIRPLWIPQKDPAPRLSLQPLQEWEGYVTDIGLETFSARLVDLTAGQNVEEESAEFPISDLSDDELSLLKEGAVFRWVIGYQRSSGGTKRRVSEIVFRRLPAWTKRDLREAQTKAARLLEEVAWE